LRAKIVLPMIFSIILILGTTQTAFAGTPFQIDIDPGNDPNFINPLCASKIPVAILGSTTFDASDVDVSTLAFGPSGAGEMGSVLVDVNGDGLTDLVSIYRQDQTGIGPFDTEACLTGQLNDGTPFVGCDSIVITNVCVVSLAVGGDIIPLDSTMVLVAGAQTTVAWMIPVIVSGIGFAIVIARKF